eukprot:1949924-Alexandrium_andersonii.AAC.1
MKTGSPDGDASPMLARKPTRWASSSLEVLKRVCLRCTNESEPEPTCWHRHGVLQGRLGSGVNRTAEAAVHPPALCTAILRGIAAERAREGRVLPRHVERRLDEGRALYSLEEGRQLSDDSEVVPDEDYADAEIRDSDAQCWGHSH